MESNLLVSAIIPARNEEASITRAVESVAAQPEVEEIIVVDDQSTDRTSSILAELKALIPRLRILATNGLPTGWIGKNYAASLGANAARGEWLLFTDADTCHLPGSTRRALADAVDHNAVLVSYSPEQEMDSFAERALIPFVYCRLARNFFFARVNNPALPDAAANGQYLLVLRDAYEAVGGHGAVAGEILEDVALARRLKRAGYGIYFTAPVGVVRTRMYRTFRALWQGWTKNLYLLMGATPISLLLELVEVFPWLELGALVVLWDYVVRRHGASPWLLLLFALAALLWRQLRYGVDLYRNLFPVFLIKYYVPGMCLYIAALLGSWGKHASGSVAWKGREYPAGTP